MEHIFLIEIGTEDLPSSLLFGLGQSFVNNICSEFNNAYILYKKISWFVSSRRLSVIMDITVDDKLLNYFPNLNIGVMQVFKSNNDIVQIINSWSKNYKTSIDHDYFKIFNGSRWLVYREINSSKFINNLLCELVNNAILKVPLTRSMRFGDSIFRFIRPIHTVVILLNNEVIKGSVFGIQTTQIVRGHFSMGDKNIFIHHSNSYVNLLRDKGFVIVDHSLRKNMIISGIQSITRKMNVFCSINNVLLEEIVSLVEYPIILHGSFDKRYLDIPDELLKYIIECNRKCFSVTDISGNLLPYFIVVVNIQSNNFRKIISDNEKILQSMLIDTLFFLNIDKNVVLSSYLPKLQKVLFHKCCGSLFDKINRIEYLSNLIAICINSNVILAKRAANLSKCDLLTNIVYEFPDLRGIIGMYYAMRDGEDQEVALALKEQYYPRFYGDKIPTSCISYILSLADRIDTVLSMFSIGEYPKGNRDPFALRKLVISIICIILHNKLSLNLHSLIKDVLMIYNKLLPYEKILNDVESFFLKRIFFLYKHNGYNTHVVKLLLGSSLIDLLDFDKRVQVIHKFMSTKEFALLQRVTKRIKNIIFKFNKELDSSLNYSLFEYDEEIALANALYNTKNSLGVLIENKCYLDVLMNLVNLCDSINKFFNNVFIMSLNKDVRINRLILLKQIYDIFVSIIDMSLLK